MTFRKATLSDIEILVQLVNSAYRGDSSKVGWTTEADILGGQRTDEGKLREMVEDVDSRIELLLNKNEILGCVYLKNEKSALYFGMLTVKPNLQSQGIGKKLLARIEEIARELNLPKIRMTVISLRDELISYYERRGYQRTGKIEPFPEHDPRFGLPKIKGLVFHEFEKLIR